MTVQDIVLAINTGGTLAIGSICFFIVYTTFKGIKDEEIHEFSRRFMMSIAILLLYVSYLMAHDTFLHVYEFSVYPLYLILSLVFIYLIYAALAFEDLAQKYGISTEDKLERMEKGEM